MSLSVPAFPIASMHALLGVTGSDTVHCSTVRLTVGLTVSDLTNSRLTVLLLVLAAYC